MSRNHLFLSLLAVLACAATVCSSASVATATARLPMSRSMIVEMLPPLEPEGFFSVYVLDRGRWQEVGNMAFDQYLREQSLSVPESINWDGSIRIRLVREGGGAAHIDALSLGGSCPEEAYGFIDPDGLMKLAKADSDVINAPEESLDVLFQTAGADREIKLTARIENKVIPDTPFLFPPQNTFTTLSEDSDYYTYRLSASAEGAGDATADDTVFLKEFSLTGSGHPSGYTYAWVSNDSENLYVTMEFTSDNTRDGGEDYASVFVKNSAGIKEFRVSENQTEWGIPQFVYTDKAEYQHKLYSFSIPLKQIDSLADMRDQDIDLAFAAYGTAFPNPSPDSYDFGEIIVGQSSSPLTITVYISAGPLLDPAITHKGPDDSMFEIFNNTCDGAPPIGQNCTFQVRFKPTSIGEKYDVLTITDVNNYNATVSLSGTGIESPPAASPVPTLTEWGMVAMAILMLGIAGIVYRYRSRRSL